MRSPDSDKVFAGSIPEVYDRYLVPLIFESYAADLANRLSSRRVQSVLELACGTGAVTRQLAATLPTGVSIVATDLNQPMLDFAGGIGTARPVEWRRTDATELPFEAGAVDAVVCQFAVMFFPDRVRAFAEARRVLKPGGLLLFSVWDRIEENEFADVVTQTLGTLYPHDPPRFLARTPHGYHDAAVIERDLRSAGFASSPQITTLEARSRAVSAEVPAIAYCHGTPLRNEIEAVDLGGLERATEAATEAIARRFGPGPVDGKIQGHIITVESA